MDELKMCRHPGVHLGESGVASWLTKWDDSNLGKSAIDVGNKSSWILKNSN